EGVEYGARRTTAEAKQEMTGKGQAGNGPALGPRGVDPQYAEGDRQAAPAVDHPGEIGVVQIVVAGAVPFVAEAVDQRGVERRDLPAQSLARVVVRGAVLADLPGDALEMPPIGAGIEIAPRQQRQRQRRRGDVEFLLR